ncbi:hypothetical protein [Pseudomonas guariconensis]|uniref:hypothetical protein n=1 Tax=Pseudomonas guariconensis TaxID=1288410 RepID=UPI0039057E05
MKAKSALALFGATLLAGCSHQTPQVISQAGPVSELQVSIGKCMSVPPPAEEGTRVLGEAVAKVLISSGVNYLGQAAAKAGEAKTWSIQGTRNFQAPAAEFPQCIQVVRGRFHTEGPAAGGWALPPSSKWPADTKSQFDQRGIYLAAMPDFLFEAQVVPSADNKAFSVRPAIATYLSPIATRFLRPSKERNIALFFAITPPGTKPTMENNPSASVLVGAMEPWTTRKYATDSEQSSVYESPWFTIGTDDTNKSLTLTVLMTETQGEQAFLKFIGSVLTEPTVVSAANADAQDRFIPSVHRANQAADDRVKIDAEQARDAAYAVYAEKITACANEPDVAARRAFAREAKGAMGDYVKAEEGLLSPKGAISRGLIETIEVNGDSSALLARCKALAGKLAK